MRSKGAGAAGDPLYVQLARTLKDEIVSGVYPIGTQLPKEDLLRARFEVSRFTVREALRLLRDEGLVQPRQGAGTVVVPVVTADTQVHNVMSIDDLDAFASTTRLELSSIRSLPLGKKLAGRVGVPPGELWLHAAGYRFGAAAAPVSRIEFFIKHEFSGVERLLARHNGPVFPMIEDLYAVQVVEVRQEIRAAATTQALALAFDIAPGDPVLEIVRSYSLADGKIAQVTVNTHPATRFRHSMVMRRVKAG